jgi:cyclin-dependent kinase 9
MQGNTEQQQLAFISQLCGSVIPEAWPGVESLPLYNVMKLPSGQERKVCHCKVSWPFAFGCV